MAATVAAISTIAPKMYLFLSRTMTAKAPAQRSTRSQAEAASAHSTASAVWVALQQARLFTQSAGVTGIVLTKLDGTAKGGIAVAIARELNLPVRFVGVGEQMSDLLEFSAEDFVDALLG